MIYNFKEDASVCNLSFADNSEIFGVFDGHGGPFISKFAAANFEDIFKGYLDASCSIENALIQTFVKLDEMLKEEEINDYLYCIKQSYGVPDNKFNFNFTKLGQSKLYSSTSTEDSSNTTFNNNVFRDSLGSVEISEYTKAFEDAIKIYEGNESINSAKYPVRRENIAKNMGTTANVIYIKNCNIYVANVGDSLSVMYKNKKAIMLNTEHKPSISSEEDRIYSSGSKIINNRVEGKLNLTRAIGDFAFKDNLILKPYEQAVICYPEISKFEIDSDVDFIVMGCDGIWDCVDAQRFCDEINDRLQKFKDNPTQLVSALFDKLISKSKECKFIH